MFKIVKAKKTEAKEIRQIIKDSLDKVVSKYYSKKVVSAIYEYYSVERINSYDIVFVAKEGEKIVGCVAYKDNELKMLYPDPEFRDRRYVAEMLLALAKNDLAKKGYKFGWGNALDSSVRFLEKHQAEKVKVLEDKIGNVRFRVTRMKFPLR